MPFSDSPGFYHVSLTLLETHHHVLREARWWFVKSNNFRPPSFPHYVQPKPDHLLSQWAHLLCSLEKLMEPVGMGMIESVSY